MKVARFNGKVRRYTLRSPKGVIRIDGMRWQVAIVVSEHGCSFGDAAALWRLFLLVENALGHIDRAELASFAIACDPSRRCHRQLVLRQTSKTKWNRMVVNAAQLIPNGWFCRFQSSFLESNNN